MDNPLATLFTISINGENQETYYVRPAADNVPFVLLIHIQDRYLMFDFEELQFINVTRETYQDLQRYHSVEIVGSKSPWVEIPLQGHPSRIGKSSHKISKSEHEALANLNQSSDNALSQYVRTEQLLDSLAKDDY